MDPAKGKWLLHSVDSLAGHGPSKREMVVAFCGIIGWSWTQQKGNGCCILWTHWLVMDPAKGKWLLHSVDSLAGHGPSKREMVVAFCGIIGWSWTQQKGNGCCILWNQWLVMDPAKGKWLLHSVDSLAGHGPSKREMVVAFCGIIGWSWTQQKGNGCFYLFCGPFCGPHGWQWTKAVT